MIDEQRWTLLALAVPAALGAADLAMKVSAR